LKNPNPILGKLYNQTREVLVGTADDDTFYPGGGWDVVDGGLGIDTVVVIGRSSQFKLVLENGVTYIDALSGASASTERTELINVELVQFLDKTVNLVVNDTFKGQAGTDLFDGGLGTDTVVYSGPLVQYTVNKSGSRYIVSEPTGSDGTDYLTNIERLKFKDKFIAIDLDGNAGTTAKILGAVFGKESVLNKSYVGIGLSFLDVGWTYDNLAALVLDAAGAKTNDQIVSLLWTNVIGTKPTAADKQPFIALLENGMTAGALAHLAADTSFNTTNINLVGLAQTGIEYIPVS
jgi:Ca2+-binding RTX toxin-like protein